MTTSPVIRQATEADIPRLIEIRAAVRENQLRDPSRATPADYTWFIAHSDIWLWTDYGTILGFSAGDPRDGSIWALLDYGDDPGQILTQGLLRRDVRTAAGAAVGTAAARAAW